MAVDIRGVCPLLHVYDMPASVRFYRDTLGFEIITTSSHLGSEDTFHWCLLRLGGSEMMLNTLYEFDDERPVPPDPARAIAHQDTCLYFGSPEVEALYEELRAKDFPIEPPKTAPYGMKQLYLRDPDGYGLCFQWPAEPDDSNR